MNQEAGAFYKTAKWKRIRERILRRDKYMCQISKRYGVHREAQTVHHIFPRDKFPEYELKEWNLISVTNEQHNALHTRQTNELSEEGKKLLRRICAKYGKKVPEEYS